LLVITAVAILASEAWSQDAKAPRKTARLAPDAKHDKSKLYGILWHKSVDSALAAATAARPAKPVFVLRTLGNLAGLT
jgi:hypothetical protein